MTVHSVVDNIMDCLLFTSHTQTTNLLTYLLRIHSLLIKSVILVIPDISPKVHESFPKTSCLLKNCPEPFTKSQIYLL